MKTIIINLSIAICFSFFHCNEEKDKQSSIIVRSHPDVTFTEGFGGQVVFLSYVFSSTNGDELNFIAFTSDPSVATVNIEQGNILETTELIINGVGDGTVTITIIANGSRGETASTTFKLTVIGRESLLACDFEVCPYELGASSRPVQIERELINVRAKIVKTNIIREYGITIDSFYLENPGPSPFKHLPDPEGLAYLRLLVPCRMIDTRFRVNEKQIIISGYVLNCAAGLTLPNIRGSLGNLFKLTDIKEFSSNTN